MCVQVQLLSKRNTERSLQAANKTEYMRRDAPDMVACAAWTRAREGRERGTREGERRARFTQYQRRPCGREPSDSRRSSDALLGVRHRARPAPGSPRAAGPRRHCPSPVVSPGSQTRTAELCNTQLVRTQDPAFPDARAHPRWPAPVTAADSLTAHHVG